MRNKIVFGLLFLCLIYLTECKRFGGSRSSSGGWGKSWGSSSGSSSWGSSGSSYKPSSSSSWGSSGSSYKPSSSWNTGSSWSSSGSSYKPSYPASTGLSGTGSGSHGYPSSTGLSGSGSSYKPSYPASTGLSGTGSGSHGYPSSTGLSGSGSRYKPSYPSSTGLSGSGSGSHSYPSSSTGLSGSNPSIWTGLSSGSSNNYKPSSSGTHYTGSNNNYRPQNTYNTNTGYGSNNHHPGSYVPHTTYYTAPQHVYVTQYRDSGSRYSDLLTGLALYDLGRSHSHYHNHYYNDDYYRNRYYSSGSSSYRPESQPEKEAVCSLIVKENGKTNVLKVPCEIVSTFSEGSKKVEIKRVCTSNVTVIRNGVANVSNPQPTNVTSTSINNITLSNVSLSNGNLTGLNNTAVNATSSLASNSTDDSRRKILASMELATNATLTTLLTESNIKFFNKLDEGTNDPPNTTLNKLLSNLGLQSTTMAPVKMDSNVANKTMKYESTSVNGTATITNVTIIKPNETFINITICNETNSNNIVNDPLSATGTWLDPSKTECAVDIKTKEAHLRNTVDCKVLMEYSRKPVPKKDPPLLPERGTLKSWLNKPPWWASIFIAV